VHHHDHDTVTSASGLAGSGLAGSGLAGSGRDGVAGKRGC
jgi:hypothetical protein